MDWRLIRKEPHKTAARERKTKSVRKKKKAKKTKHERASKRKAAASKRAAEAKKKKAKKSRCGVKPGYYEIQTSGVHAGRSARQPAGWGLSAWNGHGAKRNGASSWVAVHQGSYWPMIWSVLPSKRTKGAYTIKTSKWGPTKGNQPAGWGLSAWNAHGAKRNSASSRVAVHSGNYWLMDWYICASKRTKGTYTIKTSGVHSKTSAKQPAGWGLAAWQLHGGKRNSASSWVYVHSGNHWLMDWRLIRKEPHKTAARERKTKSIRKEKAVKAAAKKREGAKKYHAMFLAKKEKAAKDEKKSKARAKERKNKEKAAKEKKGKAVAREKAAKLNREKNAKRKAAEQRAKHHERRAKTAERSAKERSHKVERGNKARARVERTNKARIRTTRHEWTGYLNNMDRALSYSVGGKTYISGLSSYHNNGYEDRRFRVLRTTIGTTQYGGRWSGWVNNMDAYFAYKCPNNHAMVGLMSYHNNGNEDRRWRFKCAGFHGVGFRRGSWPGWQTNWDAQFNINCGHNPVVGFSSYHNNQKEDRRWRIQCGRRYSRV